MFISLIMLAIFLAFLALLIYTVVVSMQDAKRRGVSPVAIGLAVFFFFPLGLILWLLLRPKKIDSSGSGFNLEDHRVQ